MLDKIKSEKESMRKPKLELGQKVEVLRKLVDRDSGYELITYAPGIITGIFYDPRYCNEVDYIYNVLLKFANNVIRVCENIPEEVRPLYEN